MKKTYWHLEHLEHKPTDYEIATTNLHYYIPRGFEVQVPIQEWYFLYHS